jgi:Zn finger protein HypA/HybF involved in hydrogenase expression
MFIQRFTVKCKRCNYEWYPRKDEVRTCPKCKSAWWDTDSQKKLKELKKNHSLLNR